ncbi:lysine N(6)-hydroxylase/L-ornithine N(5)-oxygenase family protein [Flavivirga jejuensis]|uniref:SidA/IucD/PvdA family monooxygenase n=1 Tax=Flavivirga jejuensis TaxID=870487 RepID=A0ABT8WLM8_9FLAO|nr:SidA/IucD/PvdA family monooxygenase [Flavivirga jejuensis]MDO5974018.1 SidA/IucD/PvdA family monooxygenase [Flavivirga jejuensis]
MSSTKIYSVIGVGIGPFNLGLAALIDPVEELSAIFFDQVEAFDWHPGLMLDYVTLQTPFLCDCVSMADPTNPYSFLNFLKQTGRLYKFFIRENFYILRKEYNLYCKWVSQQLSSCKFSHRVSSLAYKDGVYEVTVQNLKENKSVIYYAENLVLGTGTKPIVPEFINEDVKNNVFHTSDYLYKKEELLESTSVTIIGSGQSSAEVFYDLLQQKPDSLRLKWYTRPDRLFPMEYSKLTLELTSPDFVDYFFNMPSDKQKGMLSSQFSQFKGINYDLINEIYDTLYMMSVGDKEVNVKIQPNSQLDDIEKNINGCYTLQFTQVEQERKFEDTSEYVVLGTGYKYSEPKFLQGISERISRKDNGQFDVSRNYNIGAHANDIFVQNAEIHTHSLISTDLGMGAYRNSHIINQIAGREVYKIEKRIAFQDFGVEAKKHEVKVLEEK